MLRHLASASNRGDERWHLRAGANSNSRAMLGSDGMNEPISSALREFILDHIESVADLEGLLLLRRENARQWDVPAVAKALYVAEPIAANVLTRLQTLGLLTFEGGFYSYAPKTADLRMMVDSLADTYGRALIPVTHLVHNNPRRLRRFADAFKFRKDP
jgi:hypothetical protein